MGVHPTYLVFVFVRERERREEKGDEEKQRKGKAKKGETASNQGARAGVPGYWTRPPASLQEEGR